MNDAKKKCKIEGCQTKKHAHGFCQMHLVRWKKYGDPHFSQTNRNPPEFCSIDGCNGLYESKGYCKKHLTRFKRHGDPLTVKTPRIAYTLRGDKQIIIKGDYALIELTRGASAIIDLEDVPRVMLHTWQLATHGYANADIDGKKVYLHRFILNAKQGDHVDHTNHNRLDNRKCNIRICTPNQNMMNTRKRKDCTSKYKGVFHEGDGKWRAYILSKEKRLEIGTFPTEQAAARAYDAKARELFGDFAFLNFPANDNEQVETISVSPRIQKKMNNIARILDEIL